MLSNLLIYRFLIFNSLMIGGAVALWMNDLLLPLFTNDQSRLSLVIVVLFVVGFLWSAKETAGISFALNHNKQYGAAPAINAQRVKDLAKVEWLSSVSDWLTALGLLGTVIGFSIALSGIDQSTTTSTSGAQSAVEHLMQGMRIALNTTLIGASLAIWHEINTRMLHTALEVYWADRMVAMHNGTEPAE